MIPQILLLSGVMDVRERYLRAYAGIDEALLIADGGTQIVLTHFKRALFDKLSEYHDTVSPLILTAAAGYGPDPADWEGRGLDRITDATVRGFDQLTSLHVQLTKYLPHRRRTREDLGFVLYRALKLSLLSDSQAKLLSVHESENLTWEADTFTDGSGNHAAAIAVPWIETLGPLRWPLILHELGHYLLPGGQLLKEPIENARDESWSKGDVAAFEEIVADAIAQHYFGDAYAFALAREGYLLSYKRHSEGGVSVRTRLDLLGSPSSLLTAIPEQWHLGVREQSDEATEEQETDPATAQDMRERAIRLLGECGITPTKHDSDAVESARQLIRANEPAAAVYGPSVDSSDVLDMLHQSLTSDARLPTSQIVAMAGLALQRPLTDGEILKAAWLEECDRDASYYVDTLTSTLDEGEVDRQSQEILRRDTWLARALQSAAVHRWLLDAENLTTPPVEMVDDDASTPSASSVELARITDEVDYKSLESSPLGSLALIRRLRLPLADPDRLI